MQTGEIRRSREKRLHTADLARDEGAVARRPQIRAYEADLEHCVKSGQQNEREDDPELRWETVDGNAVVHLGVGPPSLHGRRNRVAKLRGSPNERSGDGVGSSEQLFDFVALRALPARGAPRRAP